MDKIDIDLGDLTISHDIEIGRLVAALFSEDDIGAIIRCHFEMERAIVYALGVITQDRWKVAKPAYLSDKLNLLEMLGLSRHLLAPARALNRHRNALAHNGLEKLTSAHEREFTGLVRAVCPQFHDDYTIQIRGKRTFDATFRDCSTKERYVISAGIAMMLLAASPEMLGKYHSQSAEGQGSVHQ